MSTKIEIPFEIGQSVWLIENRQERQWQDCPSCGGHGRVELKDGSYRCPKCLGRKGNTIYKPTQWKLALGFGHHGEVRYRSPMTIGQIRIQIGHEPETRVMFEETGVGSGTLWEAGDIFLTKEEAESECERRNSVSSD